MTLERCVNVEEVLGTMIRFRNSNYKINDYQVAVHADHLAHPIRVRTIRHLLTHESATFREFQNMHGLATSTMERHINELIEADFLKKHVLSDLGDDASVIYTLNREKWQYCRKILLEFLE